MWKHPKELSNGLFFDGLALVMGANIFTYLENENDESKK